VRNHLQWKTQSTIEPASERTQVTQRRLRLVSLLALRLAAITWTWVFYREIYHS
jgi:hypothetical protein